MNAPRMCACLSSFLSLFCFVSIVHASYFTVEVKDKEVQCFYMTSTQNDQVVLEYQVISGGHYDIDVVLHDPSQNNIFNKEKSSYESFPYKVNVTGDYELCLSNVMSTIAHKTVFIYWEANNQDNMQGNEKKPSAMTLIESAAFTIHESLRLVQRHQAHSRNSEASDRILSESLNYLVLMWSMAQAVIVMIVSLGQVYILRSFFSDSRAMKKAHPIR